MKKIDDRTFWISSIICIVSPIIVYCITLHALDFTDSPTDFGTFGDYIGGTVGTIVGVISIFLLYKTYTSQVKYTRKQDALIKRQQFETTFFNLLEQQQIIKNHLKGEIGNEEYEGVFLLHKLRNDLSNAISNLNYIQDEVKEGNEVMLKNKVNLLYADFFIPNVSNLGHYFRHQYHILKYINESRMPNDKDYADLFQAQLSNDELYLIAINGISDYGRNRMLPLMDKYSILENFNANNDMLIVKLLSIFYKNTRNKYLINNMGKIVFVGGVHGVGKTTFVNVIKGNCQQVEGLSCSEILKWENPSHKEVEDVEENQNKLLANLPYFIDKDKDYVLDGHFCLLNQGRNIERVPIEVFEFINPRTIIVLEADPDVICERLNQRDSQDYSVELITVFQNQEKIYAKEVADTLGIPIEYCKSTDLESVAKKMVTLFNA